MGSVKAGVTLMMNKIQLCNTIIIASAIRITDFQGVGCGDGYENGSGYGDGYGVGCGNDWGDGYGNGRLRCWPNGDGYGKGGKIIKIIY